MIVGFQGEPGAFSEEATRALFGPVTTRGYASFDELVEAVDKGHVTHGLLPCENTIAGPIARAYDLLYEHERVTIVGEVTHGIEQCLIGMPGSTIDELVTVASHPVALEQCRLFLTRHPHVHGEVAHDTAGAVRAMVQRNDPARAAIGPALAAQRYGAAVIARSIQDRADNATRFFAISTHANRIGNAGKAAFAVRLPHVAGSLYSALGVLAAQGLNLRSLVARPDGTTPFEYIFYVEIDAPDACDVNALAAALGPHTRVLGRY